MKIANFFKERSNWAGKKNLVVIKKKFGYQGTDINEI